MKEIISSTQTSPASEREAYLLRHSKAKTQKFEVQTSSSCNQHLAQFMTWRNFLDEVLLKAHKVFPNNLIYWYMM